MEHLWDLLSRETLYMLHLYFCSIYSSFYKDEWCIALISICVCSVTDGVVNGIDMELAPLESDLEDSVFSEHR